MSRSVSLRHVAALDGLRGMAVGAVLLFHAGHLDGGYLGVDLFFVLSGFLITSLLLTESRASGSIALGAFWARRARRLLPALAGVLVGVAVYALVFAEPTELVQIRNDALATIAYVANWRAVLAGHDYWSLFQTPSPLEHTWSLAIEEQFYLLWPLVFVGLLAWWKQAAPRAVLVTAVGLAAVSSALMLGLYESADPSRVYYGTDTRAAAVLYGAALAAALAIWGPVRGRRARLALELGAVAAAAVLAAAWIGLDGQSSTLYHGGLVACGLAATLVIAAAAHPEAGVISRALGWRPICLLGLVSYGVYLWHWPVFLVVDAERTGLEGWPLFTVQCVVTLAIAAASYLVIEMPVRRGALPAARWRAIVPVGAVALVALLLLSTAADPPPTASAAGGLDAADALEGNSPRALRAQRAAIDARIPPSTPRILMTGDSVALSIALGAPKRAKSPLAVASATILGCGISAGEPVGLRHFSPDSVCGEWPAIWRRGIDTFRPRAVVLLIGAWDVHPRRVAGRVMPAMSPALRTHVMSRLDRALGIAQEGGAPLIILTTPCFRPDPSSAAAADLHDLAEADRIAWFNEILRDFTDEHPGSATLIDLDGFVCPGHRYQGELDGVRQRQDGIHFTQAGAEHVWDWLMPELVAQLEATEALRR